MCRYGVQNGFVAVPSVPDGAVPNGRVTLRHNRDRKTVATEGNPPSLVSKMCKKTVQNGFSVVPSVSDGGSKPSLAEREHYTGIHCAQPESKVSEWLSKMTHKTHKTHKTRITRTVLSSAGIQSVGVV